MAASISSKELIFLVLVSITVTNYLVIARDPDILSDFIVPPGTTNPPESNFFTHTGFRNLLTAPAPPQNNVTITTVTKAEFPALEGQGISCILLRFGGGATNPPHSHPRAAEIIFLLKGNLNIGFIDTTNKLYAQTLQVGDLFVVPKGLVHYEYNSDSQNSAIAVSIFGSANFGRVSIPQTLFTTNIDDNVLAKSFNTDVATIQALKNGLKPKP